MSAVTAASSNKAGMMSNEKDPALDASRLVVFRPYLQMLARMAWGGRIQAKLDASDIVQQTLLQAQRSLDQFQGSADAELAAWLRQILANELAQARRNFRQDKRDLAREISYDALLEQSSMRISGVAIEDEASPGERAEFNERALRIATAVESLPEGQREAVILHYFQDLTVPEIAQRLQRSTTAVAGLVHRGLTKLRSMLSEDE